MMDVATILSYGLEYLKVKSMDDGIVIENPELITHSLLHDLKSMVVDLQNLKANQEYLRQMLDDALDEQSGRIKIPHRCPVCNGSTFDEEGALCHPCDGRGIVWG
jgi:hypothetical protein